MLSVVTGRFQPALESALVTHAGRQTPATRLRFESRRLDSGSRTQFEVTAGTAGDLRGVPLVIEWQPRWWLRATLRLVETSSAAR